MTDALRYEWVRLRTLRSTYWLAGLSLAAAALIGLTPLGLHKGPLDINDYGNIVTGGGMFVASIFLGLVGIFAMGHEYRYGTIRPTLGAVPRRSVLMAAKLLVVMVFVAVMVVLCLAVEYLVAWIILGDRLTTLGFLPGPIGRVYLGLFGYIVVYALIGLALASLSRSMPAAIVILLLFPLLVENLLRGLLGIHALHSIRWIAKILPFSAGQQAFAFQRVDSGNAGFNEVPGPWTGALTYVLFFSLLMAIAWVLFEKRDA